MGRAFTEHTVIEVADERWTIGVRLTYSIHLGTVTFFFSFPPAAVLLMHGNSPSIGIARTAVGLCASNPPSFIPKDSNETWGGEGGEGEIPLALVRSEGYV